VTKWIEKGCKYDEEEVRGRLEKLFLSKVKAPKSIAKKSFPWMRLQWSPKNLNNIK
jgi:hypothetical protein